MWYGGMQCMWYGGMQYVCLCVVRLPVCKLSLVIFLSCSSFYLQRQGLFRILGLADSGQAGQPVCPRDPCFFLLSAGVTGSHHACLFSQVDSGDLNYSLHLCKAIYLLSHASYSLINICVEYIFPNILLSNLIHCVIHIRYSHFVIGLLLSNFEN